MFPKVVQNLPTKTVNNAAFTVYIMCLAICNVYTVDLQNTIPFSWSQQRLKWRKNVTTNFQNLNLSKDRVKKY